MPSSTLLAEPPVRVALPRTLKAIRQPVEADMKAFRTYFRESMRSEVYLLDKVTQYVLRQKGKEIRPMLVLLTARMCGEINPTSYRAAALVELLHTATLVHDDVVDEADRRRGMFSINALWKNKIAVLLGDFLLSRGLLLALDHREHELLHVVSDAVRRMSEGELLQIEKARRQDIDEETYFRIISDKTASLIESCMVCGAVSVGADESEQSTIRDIGSKLGLAFQIRDDLFDYGTDNVGKPLGIDLQERKMTLPLIVALQRAKPAEVKRIRKLVKRKKKSRATINDIQAFVTAQDGLNEARDRMEALVHEASLLLETFPPSEARDALLGLAAYVAARKN